MKLNLTQLALTAGLGLGMLSVGSAAEAKMTWNGSSLSGQQAKGIGGNSSSLGRQTDKQLQTQSKGISLQGSSFTGQTTKLSQQQSKGLSDNSSSLTGQKTEKQSAQ